MTEPAAGGASAARRLLVATPLIGDPNFERAVVFMIEHNDEGALGVVLNRPSGTQVIDAVPQWGDLAATPAVVFVGGPVSPEAVLGLATASPDRSDDGWTQVMERIGTVDLNRDPADLEPGLQRVRLFAGYAGWSPGQLEVELEAGAWFLIDAGPNDVLTEDPEALWNSVLGRQPGQLGWFANYPPDPQLN